MCSLAKVHAKILGYSQSLLEYGASKEDKFIENEIKMVNSKGQQCGPTCIISGTHGRDPWEERIFKRP